MTRSHLHLDRTASCWLIRRVVDPQATFEFVGWEEHPAIPPDARPFGLPGTELGPHDGDGTTFEKILRTHGPQDPALAELGRIVAAGVRHALRIDPPADQRPAHAALGRALDALGTGLGVFDDDQRVLAHAMPLYDALYVHCQMAVTDPAERRRVPRDPAERQAFWQERLRDPHAPLFL